MAAPDYGIDAPGVVTNLALVGLALATAATFLFPGLWFPAAAFLATAGLMLLYAKRGKFRHRERMLALVAWRGDERVLDVGTGRGLLAVGAAKRVPNGQVVGIDVWNGIDLSGNHREATVANATLEGVADRVEVLDMDARKTDFPDATFDVVLSNLCLHNIPDAAGRAEACREIARVLKPGGVALVSDMTNVRAYAKELRKGGLAVEVGRAEWWDTFPPLRIVKATK